MTTEATPDPDRELMLRLQGGEDTALNELMNRWQTPLVSFIYRYTVNEADAVDLAQETFIRVFESRHRYKPSGKFSTWLFTIASNLCRNLSRWHKRHPTVALSGPDGDGESSRQSPEETLADGNDTPVESAERRELVAAVRDSIHDLPHDLKTTLLLFEYEDLSHQEIAGIQGCTAKAIETRLYRARKVLHEKLSRWKR